MKGMSLIAFGRKIVGKRDRKISCLVVAAQALLVLPGWREKRLGKEMPACQCQRKDLLNSLLGVLIGDGAFWVRFGPGMGNF